MISHEHRCIFIHIPRCGGTSMEMAIYGQNWWKTDGGSKTKHLIASTAKRLYEPYWDDYFKFSFVRNPWDRMVSMGKYSSFYGVTFLHDRISLPGYFKKFSPIEIDPRSTSREDKFNPIENSIYLNILNEDLDFIGKLENIQEDFSVVCEAIGKPAEELVNDKSHMSKHNHYTEYYNDETREIVAEKYAKDIEYFGYKFGA